MYVGMLDSVFISKQIVMKHVYEYDRNKVFDKFEIWQIPTVNLRVTSLKHLVLRKPKFEFVHAISHLVLIIYL